MRKLTRSTLEQLLLSNYTTKDIFSPKQVGEILKRQGFNHMSFYRMLKYLIKSKKLILIETISSGTKIPPTSFYSITTICGKVIEEEIDDGKYYRYKENGAGILAQTVILGLGEKNC